MILIDDEYSAEGRRIKEAFSDVKSMMVMGMMERAQASLSSSINEPIKRALPAVCTRASLYLNVNEPIKRVHTAGRNDPCPCGSGKKFKRCCI